MNWWTVIRSSVWNISFILLRSSFLKIIDSSDRRLIGWYTIVSFGGLLGFATMWLQQASTEQENNINNIINFSKTSAFLSRCFNTSSIKSCSAALWILIFLISYCTWAGMNMLISKDGRHEASRPWHEAWRHVLISVSFTFFLDSSEVNYQVICK